MSSPVPSVADVPGSVFSVVVAHYQPVFGFGGFEVFFVPVGVTVPAEVSQINEEVSFVDGGGDGVEDFLFVAVGAVTELVHMSMFEMSIC